MWKKVILITGGAGFIGSHVIRRFVNKYSDYLIINFDKLTYAGNLENLQDVEDFDNYIFIQGDICEEERIKKVFEEYSITDVIHLAAESHVDRSILYADSFIKTNIFGTFNLLSAAKEFWKDDYQNHRFHHVSTDEVYGSLDINPDNKFTENTPYNPHSPYSASKASSDHLVKSYHDTYGMNITISNCSNNYGPNQFPEKLIPFVIDCIKESKNIPVYGTGENIRDWLYVEDHVAAIDIIFHNGQSGETYNVGGNCEMTNLSIIDKIINTYVNIKYSNPDNNHGISLTEHEISEIADKYKESITFVQDRPGHDLRYAIDSSKLRTELNWTPSETFDTGIEKTVQWYIDNYIWVDNIKSGEYSNWVYRNYENRRNLTQ